MQSVTRGTGFAFQDFAETADTLTIATERDLGVYVDYGDLAQSPWTTRNEIYNRIAALLDEFIETNLLAQHASWTNMGNGDITGGTANDTTQITVSASVIDDIIRGVRRLIRVGNGHKQMNQYGTFATWSPVHFEFLEAFAEANGFMTADEFLKNGFSEQVKYLGMNHYWNQSELAANHVFAGVRKMQRLGVMAATYGVTHDIDLPAGSSNNNLSGKGFYSRISIGRLTPKTVSGLVFDINVAN